MVVRFFSGPNPVANLCLELASAACYFKKITMALLQLSCCAAAQLVERPSKGRCLAQLYLLTWVRVSLVRC